MRIPVSHARQQLAELMRRAQAGEDVILTLRGQSPVRLVPVAGADRALPVRPAQEAAVQSS